MSEKPDQMPDDGADRRTSRGEALRLLGAGAVGVAAGASLGGAQDARAADGGNFILGQANTASSQTTLTSSNANTTPGSDRGLDVEAASATFGIVGIGSTIGVAGSGVFGLEGVGLVGAFLSGSDVPLTLAPLTNAGAPLETSSFAGDMAVDSNGVLWLCIAGGSGGDGSAPVGTWIKVSHGGVRYLPAPARAYDSRNDPAGKLSGSTGSPRTVNITSVVTSIPSAAVGIVGNLTVTEEDNPGFATIWPSGAWPGTSNINFQPGVNLSNSVSVALSGGTVLVASSTPTHVVIDVAGYIL